MSEFMKELHSAWLESGNGKRFQESQARAAREAEQRKELLVSVIAQIKDLCLEAAQKGYTFIVWNRNDVPKTLFSDLMTAQENPFFYWLGNLCQELRALGLKVEDENLPVWCISGWAP